MIVLRSVSLGFTQPRSLSLLGKLCIRGGRWYVSRLLASSSPPPKTKSRLCTGWYQVFTILLLRQRLVKHPQETLNIQPLISKRELFFKYYGEVNSKMPTSSGQAYSVFLKPSGKSQPIQMFSCHHIGKMAFYFPYKRNIPIYPYVPLQQITLILVIHPDPVSIPQASLFDTSSLLQSHIFS